MERLEGEMERLRGAQEELPQSAQAAVAEWLREGWLTRSLPSGTSEEIYEPSIAALGALRFTTGAMRPRTIASHSRLSIVTQQFARIAEETDADPQARLKSLYLEKARIDKAISEIERNGAKPMGTAEALDSIREALSLSQELVSDFRVVSAEFDRLNRGLRQKLVEHDGSRGQVLESLFAGVDLIGDSDAGRTFNGFWRLLTDPEQNALLQDSLDTIARRDFAKQLEPDDRRFLRNLTDTLVDEGTAVHDVMQSFASSLKHFVQSREYMQQQRLRSLLKGASTAALAAKDLVRARGFEFDLQMSSSAIDSISRHVLHDPSEQAPSVAMEINEPLPSDIEQASVALATAGIDVEELKRQITIALNGTSQVSIGDVLRTFPATHGLGTVFALLNLAASFGVGTPGQEIIEWDMDDGLRRRARIQSFYFLRERDELRSD